MLSRREQVKLGIFLATILYLIQPMIGTPNSQYSQFEKMTFEETYCNNVDGNWVITLVLRNAWSTDCSVWLENVHEGDNALENLVFDVIHLESTGKTVKNDKLVKEGVIIIPPNGFGFIQFKIPEKTILKDVLMVHIHSMGGMDYRQSVELKMTASIDLNVISERLHDEYLTRYYTYLRRVEFVKMLQRLDFFIIFSTWFGILLDGYLIQRQNAYLFDGYAKTRIFRENG